MSHAVLNLSIVTCRSKIGFVNVYGSTVEQGSSGRPKTLKAISNLTTAITSLKFNHDSQLLAIASNVKKDQMRLVRVVSGHITSDDVAMSDAH